MKNIQKNDQSIGQQEFNLVEKVVDDINIINAIPYPTDGSLFLLDENANVLDKDADSYPAGTIKAYGFKAGDGNYYAVDAEEISESQYWGGYRVPIESIPSIISADDAMNDYAGESNTTEIIKALKGYNDDYVTGAPAAEACRARTFNGKQGFLPALGQINDFRSHRSTVDLLQSRFSLDEFPIAPYYWSSTQYSYIESWTLDWGGYPVITTLRRNKLIVRAFFAL